MRFPLLDLVGQGVQHLPLGLLAASYAANLGSLFGCQHQLPPFEPKAGCESYVPQVRKATQRTKQTCFRSTSERHATAANHFLPLLTTNRSREYDGNQRRSVYFHRTASSGWDRTCWSICFNLWSRCACLSDTTDSKVKYNKIKGKQMQVHANPKCCTAEFRRGSGRSPVLSLDAINADRQVLRACSENW